MPRAATRVGGTPTKRAVPGRGVVKSDTRAKSAVHRDSGVASFVVSAPKGRSHGRLVGSTALRKQSRDDKRRKNAQESPLDQVVSAFVAGATRGSLVETISKLADPKAFGSKLATLAEAQATWEVALGRYLTVSETAKVLGGSSRQAVHQRIERGTLLAMDLAGQLVLPAYQFDGHEVRPEVVQTLKLLRPAGLSREGRVSWFESPQPELNGARPADWLGKDPTALYEAARHTAGSLGH